MTLGTPVLAALAVTLSVSSGGECPKGADYLVTIPDVLGACAVAFDGKSILACAPEQVADGGERQVVRALAIPGRPDPEVKLLPSGAGAAVDIDVSADGTVAIADATGAVRLIARDGTPRTIGEAVLRRPSGVAWIGDRLAVSDAALRCVFVLAADGTELARLTAPRMVEPAGLDAASDGTIFVADRLADCIWAFAPDAAGRAGGGASGGFGAARALGESGANPGQLRAPGDVAVREVDGVTCLVVADELNHRIQILDPKGAFVGFFGMHALIPRQGEGRIHYPRSVALDAEGKTLAVAEAFEDRVQVFRLKPEADEVDPSARGGTEFITSHFGADIACAEDLLALLDEETQGVALLDARNTPPIHMAIIGGSGALPMRFGKVSAIAIEPGNARVWVADSVRATIDVFDTVWDRSAPPVVDMFIPRLARSMDLRAFERRLAAAGAGAAPARTPEITDIALLRRPAVGAGTDASGSGAAAPAGAPTLEVLLLDAANRAVLRTDARLTQGTWDPLPAGCAMPTELAIAADGRIAVADPIARRVFLRAVDGSWSTLERLGSVRFLRPSGVGFGADDQLVVSDSARDGCIVASADGGATVVGERGILDEQFFDPQAIASSPLGVIVVDRGNHRFQRFAPAGDDRFAWNLTGSMGRYYDRKRKGSPGAAPASTPETRDALPRPGAVPQPGATSPTKPAPAQGTES